MMLLFLKYSLIEKSVRWVWLEKTFIQCLLIKAICYFRHFQLFNQLSLSGNAMVFRTICHFVVSRKSKGQPLAYVQSSTLWSSMHYTLKTTNALVVACISQCYFHPWHFRSRIWSNWLRLWLRKLLQIQTYRSKYWKVKSEQRILLQ